MSSAAAPRSSRSGFRPGLAATLCVIPALAILLALGTWQVQRLHWKTDLVARAQARFAQPPLPLDAALADPAAGDFRAIQASGRYRHDKAFAMGTAAVDGQVGGLVVTPLELADGRWLLVERGWVPERDLPPRVPEAILPSGEIALVGHVRDRSRERAGPFTPANAPGRRWFWYDLPAIAEAQGHAVLPLVLTLDSADIAGALPRPMPLRVDLPNNHLGYAITWYGLAAALVAVYVAFGYRRSGD